MRKFSNRYRNRKLSGGRRNLRRSKNLRRRSKNLRRRSKRSRRMRGGTVVPTIQQLKNQALLNESPNNIIQQKKNAEKFAASQTCVEYNTGLMPPFPLIHPIIRDLKDRKKFDLKLDTTQLAKDFSDQNTFKSSQEYRDEMVKNYKDVITEYWEKKCPKTN